MKIVEVAVGIVLRGDTTFITKRAEHLHQGGKWEFPGGKREADETMEQALYRELKEEIGIDTTSQTPFMLIEHDYGDKQVKLDVRLVEGFEGEPRGLEGQSGQWVAVSELDKLEFPDANGVIIEKLQKHRGK